MDDAAMDDDSGARTSAPASVVWGTASLVNHRALTADLGLPAAASDDDVLRAALARWGAAAVEHLRGAWAFAVRDEASGVVTIARDHLGVMPAYWAQDAAGGLRVSDSLAGIADGGDVDLSADPAYARAVEVRCAGLLPTHTMAIGIHRVPPGSAVRLVGTDVQVVRWWRPETAPVVTGISVEQAAAQLGDLLAEVVADVVAACRRSGTDVGAGTSDIGAHLSGGLDSTVVAVLAQSALRREGSGLSCVLSWSPDPDVVLASDLPGDPVPFDERELVRDLAAELGVPALFAAGRLGEAPWLADLDVTRQPRSTLMRESYLLPLEAERGVHHVLSGWGGDEFVSFNGRKVNRALVRSLRVGALRGAYRDLRGRGLSPVRAVLSLADAGLPSGLPRPGGDRLSEHQLARVRAVEGSAGQFPELAAAFHADQAALAGAPDARAYQLALLDHGHLSRRIDSWHEAGRRFGVRYHYPLLDVRLVEWALSMPPETFRLGDHSRRVFRLAFSGLVPERVHRSAKDDPVLLRLVRVQAEQRRAAGG